MKPELLTAPFFVIVRSNDQGGRYAAKERRGDEAGEYAGPDAGAVTHDAADVDGDDEGQRGGRLADDSVADIG